MFEKDLLTTYSILFQCASHTAVAGWKCPCCDVISATSSAAQRHMETHTGVKAYRCTICKYKGNTLRGMKTHIRMHFDKRSPDLQVRVSWKPSNII